MITYTVSPSRKDQPRHDATADYRAAHEAAIALSRQHRRRLIVVLEWLDGDPHPRNVGTYRAGRWIDLGRA